MDIWAKMGFIVEGPAEEEQPVIFRTVKSVDELCQEGDATEVRTYRLNQEEIEALFPRKSWTVSEEKVEQLVVEGRMEFARKPKVQKSPSCRDCRFLVYVPNLVTESPAPPNLVTKKVYWRREKNGYVVEREVIVRQGLRYRPVASPWYCRVRIEKILEDFGLPKDLADDELYKFFDEIDLAPAQVTRRLMMRLNDPYVRHRRDLVYFSELTQRSWHYSPHHRPWAKSRSQMLQEALEEESCELFLPRRGR